MNASSMCVSCIISKQEKSIRQYSDETRKSEYMHRLLEIFYRHGQTQSAPWIAEQINLLYKEFWGAAEDFAEQKRRYNQLLLDMESGIERQIQSAGDPFKECIKYVCAANYIDFSAVEHVDEQTFEKLLDKAKHECVSDEEYLRFRRDLEQAKELVYLTDNCGEIVLDKVFIRHIREEFPGLRITAIVRGEDVINDATMEDAREVGLTDLVPCIGNGNAAPGTVIKRLSEEARKALFSADVIISKGQGNFESLYGEGLNPYYLFLCKCELFVQRFGLARYESVFAREERIRVV
ncbi:MAG: ARMT1-like domain-containing protein [Acetatifactor sp.]|nr:ARMT1-like domain-containing protein [Acetatifactor sp.]